MWFSVCLYLSRYKYVYVQMFFCTSEENLSLNSHLLRFLYAFNASFSLWSERRNWDQLQSALRNAAAKPHIFLSNLLIFLVSCESAFFSFICRILTT